MMRRLGCLVFGMTAFLFGCGDGEAGEFPSLPGDVCAVQHEQEIAGHTTVVCDELYEEAPFVHLPATDAAHAFAGLYANEQGTGAKFVTTEGDEYAAGLSSAETDAEYYRHGDALYGLTLDGNKVSEFQPVLLFDPGIFLQPFMGQAFEGTISRLVSEEEGYEFLDPSLPVRVEVGSEVVKRDDLHEVGATIANRDAAVSAADGSCMPSLASYGDEGPYPEQELTLRLARVTSMHDFAENHFIFSYGDGDEPAGGNTMALAWYITPLDVATGAMSIEGHYSGQGHGTPGAIPSLELDLATAGGEPCDP